MDENEIDEVIRKGHDASALLSSDAFNDVIMELKDNYFSQWISARDVDTREKVHASALAIEDLVNWLVGRVSEGSTYENQRNKELDEFQQDQKYWPDNMMEFDDNDY